jgi:OmpR family response regulator RpaB
MIQDKKKVLLIEDDQQISKVYEIQLKREGFHTVISRDGDEAVEIFSKEKPDLVVLDLMLPKRDGFGVLEYIRKIAKDKETPILVISNLGQKGDRLRAMELGATSYMIKVDHPIKDIISTIKEHLLG